MDRQLMPPGRAVFKATLAGRLRQIRCDLYGEDGIDLLADKLHLPGRTWSNYERGVTIPGETLLEFLDLTGVEPGWLLRGVGAKFRFTPL